MALKLASQSRYPQIHIISRTKESTAPVIERLRALNPEGVYQSHASVCPVYLNVVSNMYHSCDVSLLANVKELGQRLTQQIPKLNLLVLSCGILSVQGRTETSEGHDKKMMSGRLPSNP